MLPATAQFCFQIHLHAVIGSDISKADNTHLILSKLWCFEILEDQDEDKQVVNGQALLHQVSCKVLLGQGPSFDTPDAQPEQHCCSNPQCHRLPLGLWL